MRRSWIQDKETGKLVPRSEFLAKNPRPKSLTYFKGAREFQSFKSQATGLVVTSESGHVNDMAISGCREYEGRETEQQEVDRFRMYESQALDDKISTAVEQTHHDMLYSGLTSQTEF